MIYSDIMSVNTFLSRFCEIKRVLTEAECDWETPLPPAAPNVNKKSNAWLLLVVMREGKERGRIGLFSHGDINRRDP